MNQLSVDIWTKILKTVADQHLPQHWPAAVFDYRWKSQLSQVSRGFHDILQSHEFCTQLFVSRTIPSRSPRNRLANCLHSFTFMPGNDLTPRTIPLHIYVSDPLTPADFLSFNNFLDRVHWRIRSIHLNTSSSWSPRPLPNLHHLTLKFMGPFLSIPLPANISTHFEIAPNLTRLILKSYVPLETLSAFITTLNRLVKLKTLSLSGTVYSHLVDDNEYETNTIPNLVIPTLQDLSMSLALPIDIQILEGVLPHHSPDGRLSRLEIQLYPARTQLDLLERLGAATRRALDFTSLPGTTTLSIRPGILALRRATLPFGYGPTTALVIVHAETRDPWWLHGWSTYHQIDHLDIRAAPLLTLGLLPLHICNSITLISFSHPTANANIPYIDPYKELLLDRFPIVRELVIDMSDLASRYSVAYFWHQFLWTYLDGSNPMLKYVSILNDLRNIELFIEKQPLELPSIRVIPYYSNKVRLYLFALILSIHSSVIERSESCWYLRLCCIGPAHS